MYIAQWGFFSFLYCSLGNSVSGAVSHGEVVMSNALHMLLRFAMCFDFEERSVSINTLRTSASFFASRCKYMYLYICKS